MKILLQSVLLASLPAFPGAALGASMKMIDTGTKTLSGYDEFIFVGWNKACSFALQYYSYPPTGEALQGVPDTWAVGTVTLPPGKVKAKRVWASKGVTAMAWDRKTVMRRCEEVIRSGYSPGGYTERIRNAPVAERPGLAHIIHSTAAFRLGYKMKWPPKRFDLIRVQYHSLGNCAMLLFRDTKTPRDSYRYRLVRLLNPGARRTRARAHVTNALLLYKDSNIYDAEEELAIATEMDPRYALGLYYHAVLLATHGRFDESLDRLKAAVRRNRKYALKAREAEEFDSIKKSERFRKIVGKKKYRFLKQEYDAEDFALPQAEHR